MGKPYSDLEKRALAILANGGNPATSLDKELANYWQWKINPSLATHNLPEVSTRTVGRKLNNVGINPFGLSMAVNTFAKVSVSQRSQTWASSTLETALSHQPLAGSNVGYKLGSYTPARVYARTGAAATSADRTSRVTGRKYKSYYAPADEGYTLPFGQNVDSSNFAVRQEVIRQAILVQDPTINLISFSPEKLRV